MILKKELDKISTLIGQPDRKSDDVSKKGVYWHLDHSLKVINGICGVLKNSNPEDYKWKWNTTRIYFLTIQKFPRGKAKAPKAVTADMEITQKDLKDQFAKTKNLLAEIEKLPAKSNFKHPYFDYLNLKQTKKFLKIHTVHHLKIIDDIVESYS